MKLKLKPTETEINELSLSEILDKYKDHQSIVKIQSQMNDEKNLFSFKPVTSEEVLKTIYSLLKNNKRSLTHFSPMSHFYTTWKRQKTIGFLTFSGGIEMWHWTKMG